MRAPLHGHINVLCNPLTLCRLTARKTRPAVTFADSLHRDSTFGFWNHGNRPYHSSSERIGDYASPEIAQREWSQQFVLIIPGTKDGKRRPDTDTVISGPA